MKEIEEKRFKYPELLDCCKKAIESEKCLGCQALENKNFIGNPNCEYAKMIKGEK